MNYLENKSSGRSSIRQWTALALCVVLAMIATFTSSFERADAKTAKPKPDAPQISQIRTKATKTEGLGHVTVNFSHSTASVATDILLVEVVAGKSKCLAKSTVKKSRTFCVLQNIKIGQKLRIKLRAKNARGFGRWSKPIAYTVKVGQTWRKPNSGGGATPRPNPRVDLSKTRVLSSASTKITKLESTSRNTTVRSVAVRPHAEGDIVFRTSGVVGYAQTEAGSQGGSGLIAILSDGSLVDAIPNGGAVVQEFYVAPTGDMYVVFQNSIPLVNGGATCLLAKVNTMSGVPDCVDSSLSQIRWRMGYTSAGGNAPIQFDNAGNIYYVGSTNSGQTVFRRKTNSPDPNDLINDNINLWDFVVIGDGTVVLTGQTQSSSSQWVRRLTPTGGLKNLAISTAQSLWMFADGKIYVGLWSGTMNGVKRYLPDQDALESKYWISSNTIPEGAYFSLWGASQNVPDCAPVPGNNLVPNQGFCTSGGTVVGPVFNIGSSSFGVAGSGGAQTRQLFQYYPTVAKANLQRVVNVNVAVRAGDSILVAGTDVNDVNTLSVFDPATNQETVVMDASNEIEIYSMSYNAANNSVMFSGLRFADNRFVIGEVMLG